MASLSRTEVQDPAYQAMLVEARAIQELLKTMIAEQEQRDALKPPEPPHEVVLVVQLNTSEARVMPMGSGDGTLLEFKADGQPATPPTQSMTEMYRWLMDNGYEPAKFRWMGRAMNGLRKRRQTYTKEVE